MKKILFSVILTSTAVFSYAVERDFNIQFKVKGIENQDAILAYNYGDKKFIADTIRFDQTGTALIKGKKSYEDGTYLLAFPSLNLASFEFIIRETNFQLSTDTSNLAKNMIVKGSAENQIMYDDLKNTIAVGKQVDSLTTVMNDESRQEEVREKAESEIEKLSKSFTAGREASIEKNPKALYNKILNALRDVPMSATPVNAQGDTVPNYGYTYYIHHYWDNIDFNDVALIKSPVVIPRALKFFENIYQHPDSLCSAIDILLSKASVNDETFKILTSEIINKYAKSKIMGHETIYVHLLDKYYLQGKTPWVDQETLTKMKERADALRPTLLGKVAPDITVYDLNNQPMNFYQSIDKNDFTILAFWNSECSHCKKEIPELMKIWQDSLHKQYNVGVFSISTEVEKEHVIKFIEENHLNEGFINGYDPTGRSNFRKLYDILSTPVVILLDKDKKIIGKKIAVSDIPYVISNYYEYLQTKAKAENSSSK